MKLKFTAYSRQYVAALRKYLQEKSAGSLQAALRLGRQAVAFGFETLELARIHEQAAATLKLSAGGKAQTKRAEIFFTEAITPILETHRAARNSERQLYRLNATLTRRTTELAATNQQLKDGVLRRKHAEAAFRKSRLHHAKLLKDSRELQKGLRRLTHRVMEAQEEERRKISRELQDGIAQTLLGINVRLLNLKREAGGNTKGFRNEVASAQRLVRKSVGSTRRVARKLRKA